MKRLVFVVALFASVQLVIGQEPSADGMAPAFSPVTWERLVNAADEPQNWLMYSGTLDSQRHSGLDQVHNRNVGELELKWAYQIPEIDRAETTPLVVDGVMFITEAPSNLVAVDAATGRPYWRYEHELPDDLRICCGRNNRGVAILGETLYMSTLEAHLVGIDARTGSLLWDREVADYRAGYSKTAAPLVIKDQVVTGIAGGEFGIRGFIDSYNAETGEREWRADTIPGPDHPDNRTWAGDSWRTGGSASWITGSYDADLDLVYWGTGNPGPDWNGDVRMGDNLYSDSALALNAVSGELDWYFQFTPHDVHDWDAIQVPNPGRPRIRRRDAESDDVGQPQRVLLHARPPDRRVPDRQALREADVGRRPGRERPTDTGAGYIADRGGSGRISVDRGRHQLVVTSLQPSHGAVLRECVRWRAEVLQARRGLCRR